MKRRQLTLILTLIVIIIAAITVVLTINIFTKDDGTTVDPQQDSQKESNDTLAPGSDVTSGTGTYTSDLDKETNNTNNETDNSDTDKDNSSDSGSGSSENAGSGISGTGDTETGSNPGNTASGSTAVPTSYKDFSLTSGMSAAQAYEYLDEFLDSKYSILINKQNKVGSDYAPSDLVLPQGCSYQMESTAAKALTDMLSAARQDGYSDLILYSGYRTYASQKNKFENRTQQYLNQGYSQQQAEEKAGEYLAPPGSSEHHTGLAADVCSSKIVNKYGYLDDSFDTTDEFKWLEQHCAEYGFILRYSKSAEDITGFLYEPWHYRYIGTDHAKACMALGITYEEYHSMLVKLRDEAKADANV